MGGGDVLDVENILKREAKEAERKSKKRAEDEYRRDNSAKSLFDFIIHTKKDKSRVICKILKSSSKIFRCQKKCFLKANPTKKTIHLTGCAKTNMYIVF